MQTIVSVNLEHIQSAMRSVQAHANAFISSPLNDAGITGGYVIVAAKNGVVIMELLIGQPIETMHTVRKELEEALELLFATGNGSTMEMCHPRLPEIGSIIHGNSFTIGVHGFGHRLNDVFAIAAIEAVRERNPEDISYLRELSGTTI